MKNKPPLVPWAVGHVGHVQKPVGFSGGRFYGDGESLPGYMPSAAAQAVACCGCGDREFVTRLQDERWWKVETREDVQFYCDRCLWAAKERALQTGEEAVYA